MPLRSSLARSLQYAMANMADIKTPLCALQPTPAIPHTASRSGAGTRGGGSAGSRPGAGTERASRQPPAPAGLAPRASLLGAPALRWPGGGRAGLGARTPGAGFSAVFCLGRTLTFSRSLPPGAVFRRAKVQGNSPRARRLSERQQGRTSDGASAPGSAGSGTGVTPCPALGPAGRRHSWGRPGGAAGSGRGEYTP